MAPLAPLVPRFQLLPVAAAGGGAAALAAASGPEAVPSPAAGGDVFLRLRA
jgi:hypothetical protein